jgi:tyrosinase
VKVQSPYSDFWYSNVDRLFAIWQALNPNSYTIDKRSDQNDGGTFAIREGSLELATTGLAPFYDKTGTQFWDSLGVRSTEVFNYAYPETQQWKFPSTSDYQNSVLGTVQQLYGSVGNQFVAEDAVNLMSTQAVPQAVPETVHQTTIRAKAATGSAGGPQQPIAEAAPVPKPAPEAPQAAPHTGFHPFRGLADKFKGHHNNPDNNPERGGLDLEAEIGKRMSFCVSQL